MPVAVITGSSRGLGKRIAVKLDEAGYDVAVNYLRTKQVDGIASTAANPSAAIKADMGNFREVKKMCEKVRKLWGRIDVLINNAGITKDALMVRYKEEDWDEVIRVNLKGCFNGIRAFTPLMIRSGGGHIVNIGSFSGLHGKEGQIAYGASKAAILGFTVTLAKELAEYGINVNCVLPGYMPTDMGAAAGASMEKAKAQSILGSLANSDEVAAFIVWLVSTKRITGQVFSLDSRI